MGAVTVDISAALEVQGWMSEAELRWLAEQAQTHQYIVEIGAWKGRSTLALGCNTTGLVWAVDHWRGQLLVGDTPLDDEIRERGSDAIYEEFMANTRGIKIITPMPYASSDAAVVLEEVFISLDESLRPDMVFLDGEHAYEGVAADIRAWKPLLVPGGLLCGHDWWHGGVKQAVRELVPDFKIVEGTNIWWANV